MAAQYIKEIGGYIIDNPNIDFVRCDGKVFSYDKVSTSQMNTTANSLTINGGQGAFPLAYIETDKNLEFTFAHAEFRMDMFEMAHATNASDGDIGTYETKLFEVATGLKITIPYEVQAGSVKIRNMTETDSTASTGKFKVAITAATASVDGKAEITFAAGDVAVGDSIRVSYRRRVVGGHTVDIKTNGTTSRGSLSVHWPVYSDGSDCTEASIKGWLHMEMFRTRVTAAPGFDTSYKTATTNSATFAAIDPKRPDNKVCRLTYEPLDVDGNIVAKSDGTVSWN